MVFLRGWVLLGLQTVAASLPFTLKEERIVLLHADILSVQAEQTGILASRTLELPPGSEEGFEVEVPWPSGQSAGHLRIEASGRPGAEDEPHHVSVHTLFRLDGREVRASRDLGMQETSTYLMEAFEMDGNRLVVALRAESATRPVVLGAREVGARVLFRLAIERVEGNRFTPLETNRLQTFVGEGVHYSFHRGAGDDEESVHFRLRPVRIRGDLAELEVEITGSLPGEHDRLILGRRENLLTTKGATSSIVIAVGEPPSGYRFLITPEF